MIGDGGMFLLAIFLLVASVLLYFIPYFVASRRHHRDKGSIFVLCLFFGWTFIGWVVALIWANSGNVVPADQWVTSESTGKTQSLVIRCVMAFCVLAACLAFFGWRESKTPQKATITPTSTAATDTSEADTPETPAPAYQPVEEKPTVVSAYQLYATYHANEVAADNAFKNRILQVRGIVTGIRKDALDNIVLDLASGNEFESVEATVAGDNADKAARLQQMNVVDVTCRGNGMMIGMPQLEDCSIHTEGQSTADPRFHRNSTADRRRTCRQQ